MCRLGGGTLRPAAAKRMPAIDKATRVSASGHSAMNKRILRVLAMPFCGRRPVNAARWAKATTMAL
jgi:hypothetical protein